MQIRRHIWKERTGMTLTISKVDFIGGVRAVVPEKNVLVDYAFKRGIGK